MRYLFLTGADDTRALVFKKTDEPSAEYQATSSTDASRAYQRIISRDPDATIAIVNIATAQHALST